MELANERGGLSLKRANFFFLYDLMTGGCQLTLAATDCGYNMGVLLLRSIAPQELGVKGLHLSILRIMAYNRALCKDMPKLFEEPKRTGLSAIAFGDGSLTALPMKAAKWLQGKMAELAWAPQVAHWSPPTAVRLSPAGGRSFVVPRARDRSCSARSLRPAASGVSAEEMAAFASVPMSVAGLPVVRVPGAAAAAPSGRLSLPFDISKHPASRHPTAADMLRRMEEDFNEQVAAAAKESGVTLEGFEGAYSPAARESAQRALQIVKAQVERDLAAVTQLKDRVVNGARGGRMVADLVAAGQQSAAAQGPAGLQRAALLLARLGGREASIDLECLTALLMSTSGHTELQVG